MVNLSLRKNKKIKLFKKNKAIRRNKTKKLMALSLSRWNPLAESQLHAPHGENLKAHAPPPKTSYQESIWDSLILDPMDTSDNTMLHCVNPYEINPIGGRMLDASRKDTLPGKNIKLEMEEFSDLAPFLPAKVKLNSTDELNTPIFDRKGPFDFMINNENTTTATSTTTTEDTFKFQYDTIRSVVCNNSNNNNNKHNSNDILVFDNQEHDNNIINNNNNNHSIVQQGSEAMMLFSEEDHGDVYLNVGSNETPLLKFEEPGSVMSVGQYSNVSSPEYFQLNQEYATAVASSPEYSSQNLGIETPEDSNGSTVMTEEQKVVPVLTLSLGAILGQTGAIPNTPDVIDAVVDLEGSFNILDYVSDKDVTTVNIEDIQFESPSTSTTHQQTSTTIRKRKSRNKYDDDDEDYEPPTHHHHYHLHRSKDDDSDSDYEPAVAPKRSKRRTSSVTSSEPCSDASKYRELRDKNNEASRKSRLKRKQKETTMEQEADQLEEKNLKLKAQVEELEKMVESFRTNLFKIMLRK